VVGWKAVRTNRSSAYYIVVHAAARYALGLRGRCASCSLLRAAGVAPGSYTGFRRLWPLWVTPCGVIPASESR